MKALMIAIAGCLQFAPAAAATRPVIVQSALPISTAPSQVLNFTLPQAPTPGNILVLMCSYNPTSGRTLLLPAGWSMWDKGNVNATAVISHVVGSGESASQSFSMSAINHYQTGVLYEVSGASGGVLGTLCTTTSSTIKTWDYVLPASAADGLPLFWYRINGLDGATVNAGWTPDRQALVSGISMQTYVGDFPTDQDVPITITQPVGKTYTVSGFVLAPA